MVETDNSKIGPMKGYCSSEQFNFRLRNHLMLLIELDTDLITQPIALEDVELYIYTQS